MNKIAIYIPNFNGADFLKHDYIPDKCDCIVMDNNSTDDSVNISKSRGFICIENNVMVSRTDNWLRCIDHFRKQQYDWMKWLFVGDELCEESYQIMSKAVSSANNSTIIVFDYYINTGSKKTLKSWSDHFKNGIVSAKDAKLSCIEKGPFSSPICIMLSKKCNFEKIDITDLSWAADVKMLDQLIGCNNLYYCDQSIGVFNSQLRKTYSSSKRKISSYAESIYVLYSIYRDFKKTYPNVNVNGRWFQMYMIMCLTDNINTFRDFGLTVKALFRGLVKFIFKKNGRDLKL